jgi:hypothetical protein
MWMPKYIRVKISIWFNIQNIENRKLVLIISFRNNDAR